MFEGIWYPIAKYDKNEEWCWKHCKDWHFDSLNIATDIQNQSESQQLEQSLIGDQKRI